MDLFEQDFAIDDDDSESELEIQDKQTVTGKQTAWGVQVFKDWLKEKNLPLDFENQPEEEIDKLLARFYTEARKKTGQAYGKSALTCIRSALQRHMRAPPWNRTFAIRSDRRFDRSNKVMDLLREKMEYGGMPVATHHCPLVVDEFKEFRVRGVISTHSPSSLQNLVWLHAAMHFGTGSIKEWRSMNLNTFIQKEDENGRRFITYNTSVQQICQLEETTVLFKSDVRIYERPKDPFCPVNAFNIYKSLLNKCVDSFWQMPDRNFRKTKMWYLKHPLARNTLLNMLKRMCKQAWLNKSHTNFCLQATSRKVLTDAGLERTYKKYLLTPDLRNMITRKQSYVLSSVLGAREHPPDSIEETQSSNVVPDAIQNQKKNTEYDKVSADIKPPDDDDDLFMDIKIEEEDPLGIPSTSDLSTYNENIPHKRLRIDDKVMDPMGLTEEVFIKAEDVVEIEEIPSTSENRSLESSGRIDSNSLKLLKTQALRNTAITSAITSANISANSSTNSSTNASTLKSKNEFWKDGRRLGSRDIYDVFGMHIAKTLRDINDESTFRQVKMKINDIILEALAGHYATPQENNPQTKILLPVNTSPQFIILPGNSQNPVVGNNSQMIVLPNNSQTAPDMLSQKKSKD